MAIQQTFECVDSHTCGNPVRVVKTGHPQLEGQDMGEMRLHFMRQYDWIRRGLMFEPRGHDMMSGSFIYPPKDPQNDAAILFIETSGCLPMCGHGTIGTVTVGIEKGLITPKVPGRLKLEVPAGLIDISYSLSRGKVETVKIINVPSFVAAQDLKIHHDQLGELKVSVSYGGNFYAIVEPQENYRDMADYSARELISMSSSLREKINREVNFVHPLDARITSCTHVMWTGKPERENSDGRGAVFYGENAIDRSPCGTGTSARLALLKARGELNIGDTYVHESIIGSQFVGTVEELVMIGEHEGIIPGIEGWAKITGTSQIMIDEADDPYAFGFQVK